MQKHVGVIKPTLVFLFARPSRGLLSQAAYANIIKMYYVIAIANNIHN